MKTFTDINNDLLAASRFTLAAAGCLLQASQLLDVMLAALYAVLVSAVVQTICRGRSFAVRTQDLWS